MNREESDGDLASKAGAEVTGHVKEIADHAHSQGMRAIHEPRDQGAQG